MDKCRQKSGFPDGFESVAEDGQPAVELFDGGDGHALLKAVLGAIAFGPPDGAGNPSVHEMSGVAGPVFACQDRSGCDFQEEVRHG